MQLLPGIDFAVDSDSKVLFTLCFGAPLLSHQETLKNVSRQILQRGHRATIVSFGLHLLRKITKSVPDRVIYM